MLNILSLFGTVCLEQQGSAGVVDEIEKVLASKDFTARPGVENEVNQVKADPTISAEDKQRFVKMAENKVGRTHSDGW